MSNVPNHWKRCKLGEVIRLKNGYAFKSQDYAEEGVPLVRISDINDNNVSVESAVRIPKERLKSGFYIEEGDLLIAMSGATTGKTGVYSGCKPVLQNQRVGNFKIIDETLVEKRWRNYYVASLRKEIEKAAYGGAQPNISAKIIESFDFPLAPLGEQRSIVAEIEKQFSRLDEAVANLKRVKANLKRYKAAVLKAAVEGKLTEDWRKQHPNVEPASKLLECILAERRAKWKGKYKEPSSPDTSTLLKLPHGWTWTKLDQLLKEPLRNGHSAKASGNGQGLRAFTLSAVTEGDFSKKNTKLTVAHSDKVTGLWAEPGDIYVERSNTPELVGLARLYMGPNNFAFIPDLLIRVRLIHFVLPTFVEVCLLSEDCRRYFRSRAQGISGSMPKIDQSVIEQTAIPLMPLVEQKEIVAEVERRLSVMDELEAAVEANLTRADRLRQSILSQAFSGKLSTVDAKGNDQRSTDIDRARA